MTQPWLVSCPACAGTKVKNNSKCSRCDGSGEIDVNAELEKQAKEAWGSYEDAGGPDAAEAAPYLELNRTYREVERLASR